LYAPQLTK
jgi:hypothetical protein